MLDNPGEVKCFSVVRIDNLGVDTEANSFKGRLGKALGDHLVLKILTILNRNGLPSARVEDIIQLPTQEPASYAP